MKKQFLKRSVLLYLFFQLIIFIGISFGVSETESTLAPSEVFALKSLKEELPEPLKRLLKYEIDANEWIREHVEMEIKLGRFASSHGEVFQLPYIPIPEENFKFAYIHENISERLLKEIRFSENGRSYIRYFIHPLYVDKYPELISEYGIIYGEYYATPTSSPRSLVVWRVNNAENPIWVKVSLHCTIDSYNNGPGQPPTKISRVQTMKKATRAVMMNAMVEEISPDIRRELGFDFMGEPASFVPGRTKGRNFDTATIFREIPEFFLSNSDKEYLPGFALVSASSYGGRVLLKDAIEGSSSEPLEFIKERIIRPLIRNYIYMGIFEGLQGELHVQNFYFEVDRDGVPTGKILFKDLDGFRIDLDMRIRHGKSVSALRDFSEPFTYAKHSQTQGKSGVPFLGGWFYRLIRNVNGYNTLSGYLLKFINTHYSNVPIEKNTMQNLFDFVAAEEFVKLTEVEIPDGEFGYGQNKGLNYGLNRFRQILSLDITREDVEPEIQNLLKEEYLRLAEEKRSWGEDINGKNVYFILHPENPGVIEARRFYQSNIPSRSLGYALLLPEDFESTVLFRENLQNLLPPLRLARYPFTSKERIELSSLTNQIERKYFGRPWGEFFREMVGRRSLRGAR